MKTGKENVSFGLRLRQRNPGFQTANQCESISPIFHVVQNGGDEKIGLRTWRKNGTEIESGWQDADDRYRMIVESDGLADNRGISGKLTPPQAISKNGNGVGIFQGLVGSERAAQQRLNAERREEIPDHRHGRNRQRIAIAGELSVIGGRECKVAGDILEGIILMFQLSVGVDGISHAGQASSAFGAGNKGQLLRNVKGKRPQ